MKHMLIDIRNRIEFLIGCGKAFSRLVGIVRSAVWMDLDIEETLRLYGMIMIHTITLRLGMSAAATYRRNLHPVLRHPMH